MADEKPEWGEAGQPSEGGVIRDERKPPRPAGAPSVERDGTKSPRAEKPETERKG
jgi:hypothetical protein